MSVIGKENEKVYNIMEKREAKKIIDIKKKEGKKIGFTCSAFDMLHAGHYLMLSDSKRVCDFLVVGLQTDPSLDSEYRLDTNGKNKNKPIQSYEERLIQIYGCKYVDLVIEYSTEIELYNILSEINPDVRILGSDWKNKKYTGWDLPIEIYWHKRNHNYSTSNLRLRVYLDEYGKECDKKAT
jgi:glycerol-3-phosphate cytidylyltransferase